MKKKRGVVTVKCKLLCPICNEVKRVVEVKDLVRLECGDFRQPNTLDAAPGHISFEHMRSAIGHKFFPPKQRFEENIDSGRMELNLWR